MAPQLSPSSCDLVPQLPADLSLTFQQVAGGHSTSNPENPQTLNTLKPAVPTSTPTDLEDTLVAPQLPPVLFLTSQEVPKGLNKHKRSLGQNPCHYNHISAKKRAKKKFLKKKTVDRGMTMNVTWNLELYSTSPQAHCSAPLCLNALRHNEECQVRTKRIFKKKNNAIVC